MIEYKLSDILQIADKGFKTLFGGFDFWCTGEIITITPRKNIVYMELVEYDAAGKVAAKMKAAIYDEAVCRDFLQDTKISSLSELVGMKILFHGYFLFSATRSEVTINIKELSSEYMIGQLQKKQDLIIMELEKLGILTLNKAQELGYPPYTIAVISGKTSAGLEDFEAVIAQSGYNMTYKYYYCAVHGNNAITEVDQQLQNINADIISGETIDMVAIIRGGGESSGIDRQNNLAIAAGVCRMPVPVIVAVGHTQDKSVLHEIAWYSAKTPTDGAYKLVELLQMREADVFTLFENINEIVAHRKQTIRNDVDLWFEKISDKLGRFVKDTRFHIDAWHRTIMATTPEKLLQHGYALLLKNGEYMTKESIESLDTGEMLTLKVYETEFTIEIKKKKK